jgi:hypothetical protein
MKAERILASFLSHISQHTAEDYETRKRRRRGGRRKNKSEKWTK